jgi:site-specific recombinase XerD
MMDEQTAITSIVTSAPVDVLIYGWLDAKFHRSGSEKTRQAYKDTLSQFRAVLQHQGLDLDHQEDESLVQIALIAQAFCSFSARGKQVKPATINQRTAILSSFYAYAIKQSVLTINPLDRVERSRVQAYAAVSALQPEQTTTALAHIDRSSDRGKRDYALLAILLSTGRRLSEVADLTLSNIQWHAEKATLTFEHCKGGKVMRDTLSPATSHALSEWITTFYGPTTSIQAQDNRPVWVVLKTAGSKRGSVRRGERLGEQSIADVCKKHLGTSKVHTTRHTWAHEMEKAGAKVSTIQGRLGHESLATTGRYLAALSSAENEFADTISANIGIR